MKIQIAGPGCVRCQATEKVVHQVCKDLNLPADIEHVYDLMQYIKMGVRMTPAIIVDGKVVCAGRVPTPDELKKCMSDFI